MIVSICSPDKIALSSFTGFLLHYLDTGYTVGSMHSLMSPEALKLFFEDFISKNEKPVFRYYLRLKSKIVEPMKMIPEILLDRSDTVFWFDLYSLDLKILKDRGDLSNQIGERWKQAVERANKRGG